MKGSEPPAPLPQCLAILILRVLHFTQEDVISNLHCAKLTVVEVERWFKELPLQEAESLCGDPSLRDKANKIISEIDAEEEKIDLPTAMSVGKLSKEDILCHYKGSEYLESKAQKPAGIDPAVAKAKEEHLTEVRSLIEQLKTALVTPQIHDVWLGIVSPIHAIESDPLFRSLKKHLPSKILWKDYSSYNKKMTQYLVSYNSLSKEISEIVGKWPGVKEVTRDAARPILAQISRKVQGEEPKAYEFGKSLLAGSDDEYLIVYGGVYPGPHVLLAKDTVPCRELYQTLSNEVLAGKPAADLITLFSELKDLGQKICDYLQKILLMRDYINYTCGLC